MKCLSALLCLVFAFSPLALSGEDTTNLKIDLVKNELSYCKHLLWFSQNGQLDRDIAIDWVDDIISMALDQLDEMQAH